MRSEQTPRRRVYIDRLDLDLRGIAPTTAEAAARELGPALARALASHQGEIAPAARIDAGRLASPASPTAHDLARRLAERVAGAVRGGRP